MSYRVHSKTYSIETRSKFEVIRITEFIENSVRESGIRSGYVLVFVPHATAAIAVNEYEPRIVEDYIAWVKKVFPAGAGWRHDEIDDNAHAHIASLVIGQSRVLPVLEGRLARGTWQEVLLLEFDGPRRRTVIVQVHGV
ncbi:MAG: secondary thiamine-phosphate synthase enzyme YjbQ [Sulfolobales archaeon]